MTAPTIKWTGSTDGHAELIDQTLLPCEVRVVSVKSVKEMWHAIKVLQIRGAPAIGIGAAYGVVLGVQEVPDSAPIEQLHDKLTEVCDYLAASRPTAVNLFWALGRMKKSAESAGVSTTVQLKEILLDEAKAIHREDAAMCRAIGANGAHLIAEGNGILTHCNAGGLATAEYGTALALMFTAHEQGKQFAVYADETRPLLQGARLTTWELCQAGIDVTLICDNMAGHLMKLGKIDLVITGADRIAANGDAANKIGTYAVAVLAKAHNIPFYIAAPSSTFDLATAGGDEIPIEQRDPREVSHPLGQQAAPDNVKVYNPAFDVTPHEYITAIITEKGLIESPDTAAVKSHLCK
ncbi:MAG: S-methyl-5-thioribose-1-phosphate isomerase [Phycisphaerae bacterium]|nr:S-methyl-5-thioribose-1-phosphate isomerase [Phycisphaerae bacterium]